MSAGYSGTPLVKKLGYKEGFRVIWTDAPDHYLDLLDGLPDRTEIVEDDSGDIDLAHIFVKSRMEFGQLVLQMRRRLKPNGMIWVSWPKKASKISTELTEDVIRDFALKNGLVDVKVCAVDDVWSGLKLVIPIAHR